MRTLPFVASILAIASLTAVDVTPPVPQPAPTVAVAEPEWRIPVDDAAQVTAAIEVAIKHGMPDAKGGTLFTGTLQITGEEDTTGSMHASFVSAESEDEAPPVTITEIRPPGDKTPESKATTKPHSHAGVHIRLADGSWLVRLQRVVKPSKDIVVDATKLKELKPEALRSEMKARHEPSPEELDQYMQTLPVAQRQAMKAMVRWSGVFESLGFGGDMAGPIVALIRVGVPDAHELTFVFSFLRAQMSAMMGDEAKSGAAPLLLTSADQEGYSNKQQERMQQMHAKMRGGNEKPQMTFEPLVLSTRRALSDWFQGRMAAKDQAMPVERAVQGINALLGADAPPELTELARLYSERAALPEQVPATADLITRLTVWEPIQDGEHGMSITDLSNVPAEYRAQFQKQIDAADRAKKAPRITEADLAGLIAALGETRASRWLDEGRRQWGPTQNGPTPRTIGDNALRALTTQLAIDPRRLAGRDVYAAWNPAERAATATAVQAWWKAGHGKPLGDLLVAAVPGMGCAGLAEVIDARPKGERPAFVAAIAAHWKTTPPTGAASDGLGKLLGIIGEEPALVPLIKTLPVVGPSKLALAIWRAKHQDGTALDQLFEESLTVTDMMERHQGSTVLTAISAFPTPARLARLLSLVGDWDQPPGRAIMGSTVQGTWSSSDSETRVLLDNTRGDDKASDALHHAVLLAMLSDRRAVPADLVKVQGDSMLAIGEDYRIWNHGGKKQEKLTLPADLRTCDLAAYHMASNRWEYRQEDERPSEGLGFPLSAPVAERDTVIAELRIKLSALVQDAFAAAKLPAASIPGGGAPAGDDKALF